MRDVISHLVGMNLVFVALFEESPMPARGVDRLGADPAGAYHRSAAALQAAAARPGVLERSQATPVGVATGAERLQWRIVDLLVHGWDLAQSTGVAAGLPDNLAEQALTFSGPSCPANRAPDDSPIRSRSATTHPPSTGWRHSPAGQFRGRGTTLHVYVGGVTAATDALSRIMAADLAGTWHRREPAASGGATRTDDAGFGAGGRTASWLDPAIMGPPVCWLASRASDGITGQRIVATDFADHAPA